MQDLPLRQSSVSSDIAPFLPTASSKQSPKLDAECKVQGQVLFPETLQDTARDDNIYTAMWKMEGHTCQAPQMDYPEPCLLG